MAETKTIEGVVRIQKAAVHTGLSRQWLYALGEKGTLSIENVALEGRGGTEQQVIGAQSLIDFVRGDSRFDGKRTDIINKIRGEAAKTKKAGDVLQIVKETYERFGSVDRTAVELSMGASTVKKRLIEAGVAVATKPPKELTAEEQAKIKRLHAENKGLLAIAEGMGWGASPSRVKAALVAAGVTPRSRSEAQQARRAK